jgi:DNA-binding winged helix-turn-helix (wHTH) protein
MYVVINTLRGTAAAAVVATATDETHADMPFKAAAYPLENVRVNYSAADESDLVGPRAVQPTPVPNGLVARVKALLRRRGSTATFSSETIGVGPLEIDIPGRRARVNGTDVDLTKREFDLLAVLAEHKTAVLSRAQLLELVWGYDFAADTNVVDVFIGYLRRKLEVGGAPRLLHTVRGVGFVLRTQ